MRGRAVSGVPPGRGELAGFGSRLLATLIDLIWMLPVSFTLVTLGAALHGGGGGAAGYPTPAAEALLNLIFGLVVLNFWAGPHQATPGKRVLGLRIVDAGTGGHAALGHLALRYVGYLLSALPLGLGYLWMLWDPRRQTWHDKLGRTLVVREAGASRPPPSTAPHG
ncbi:RDD family protein [Caldovatus sediminis]|uniref:RDD family protein n=1 Tax=Caldovatus sediminis TaxID=2041189 RepID=A0A8J2Z7H4_9PROT|nr:RDD family protein [Caldovatus sediminis]